jgi:hypothetical protein
MRQQKQIDLAQPYRGWCHWCGKAFRHGFTAHLAENRACMILARAMVAEQPDLHQAAGILHVHAERICSDAFAQQHRLVDMFPLADDSSAIAISNVQVQGMT